MSARDWFKVAGVAAGWSLFFGLFKPERVEAAWFTHLHLSLTCVLTAGLVAACDWVGSRWTIVRRDRGGR